MQIRRLNSGDSGFEQDFVALLSSSDEPETSVTDTVKSILDDIRERGDEALVEYTNRFDQRQVKHADLIIPQQALKDALNTISPELKQGLEQAAVRIRSYHERQRIESWSYKDNDGTLLGQHVTPLDSVGVYVPGGKAAYPSSVLMNVIPAKVAGVKEIIMVVPAPKGGINPLVLAAASIAGVTLAFSIGGAQAVAALAYGTKTVPRVDKIVGPGNIYVATAKRMVFGTVGIDMIAGPSEVLIISDGNSNPDWIAMDLFAQAEHDEEACAILICPDNEFLNSVEASIKHLLPEMERSEIIQQSLRKNGALIHVEDIHEAVEIANRVAPEHLELSVSDPEALLTKIRHAGAIFMGCNTAEALGDYCAGPNHVLPTARTARFSSPLGVYDFQKRSSMIMCSDESVSSLAGTASILARGEGLTAHARSAEFRIKKS
jgi:histidinol dehydrogenase